MKEEERKEIRHWKEMKNKNWYKEETMTRGKVYSVGIDIYACSTCKECFKVE